MKTKQEKTSVMTEHQRKAPQVSLLFVPPSPVTDMIELDIRGAVVNRSNKTMTFDVAFYLDRQEESSLLHREKIKVAAKSGTGVHFCWPTKGHAGHHQIIFVAGNSLTEFCATQKLEIIASNVRSAHKISGAWIGLTHWSEQEGQLWNKDIKLGQRNTSYWSW